ncbi:protein pmbA, partial [Vibrio parahaemolyticus V-223/04]
RMYCVVWLPAHSIAKAFIRKIVKSLPMVCWRPIY